MFYPVIHQFENGVVTFAGEIYLIKRLQTELQLETDLIIENVLMNPTVLEKLLIDLKTKYHIPSLRVFQSKRRITLRCRIDDVEEIKTAFIFISTKDTSSTTQESFEVKKSGEKLDHTSSRNVLPPPNDYPKRSASLPAETMAKNRGWLLGRSLVLLLFYYYSCHLK